MIKGVILKELTVHSDERGKLFEILRSDEKVFRKFGQAYITVCYPGWVKGWHYHKIQDDNFCVVRGTARVVLYDARQGSDTKGEVEEYILESGRPVLLLIPKGIVHGFEAVGPEECWILNIPTELYNPGKPDEFRLPLDSPEVPYEPWKKRKGY